MELAWLLGSQGEFRTEYVESPNGWIPAESRPQFGQ